VRGFGEVSGDSALTSEFAEADDEEEEEREGSSGGGG
jgi:hypothetical protein